MTEWLEKWIISLIFAPVFLRSKKTFFSKAVALFFSKKCPKLVFKKFQARNFFAQSFQNNSLRLKLGFNRIFRCCRWCKVGCHLFPQLFLRKYAWLSFFCTRFLLPDSKDKRSFNQQMPVPSRRSFKLQSFRKLRFLSQLKVLPIKFLWMKK